MTPRVSRPRPCATRPAMPGPFPRRRTRMPMRLAVRGSPTSSRARAKGPAHEPRTRGLAGVRGLPSRGETSSPDVGWCAQARGSRPRGRSPPPQGDGFEASTRRTSCPAFADMRSILVEGHGSGRIAVDLGATTFDLDLPRLGGARIRFAIKTADQLERQARPLLYRKTQYVRKNFGRSHARYLTRAPLRRRPRGYRALPWRLPRRS